MEEGFEQEETEVTEKDLAPQLLCVHLLSVSSVIS